MRRAVERKVTVELSEKEVLAAILAMARCPVRFRTSATFEQNDGGAYIVRWVEGPQADNTQPDANPKLSAARRARADRIEMKDRTYGQWKVLGPADRRAFPSGGIQTMWRCRCSCGKEQDVNGGALRSGQTTQCQACANGRVPDDERVCQYCEVKLSPKSQRPTVCPRCDRQIERMKKHVPGGLCHCGKFPYYRTKDCPKCDRKKGDPWPPLSAPSANGECATTPARSEARPTPK